MSTQCYNIPDNRLINKDILLDESSSLLGKDSFCNFNVQSITQKQITIVTEDH